MGLFDIFKKKEVIYYRDFKKFIYNLNKDDKVTISSLRIRVMTIENAIKHLSKISGLTLSDDELNDRSLKVAVLQKILKEAEQEFVEGVTIKLKEFGENDIPITYEKCKFFTMAIERKCWKEGRHIASEEIKY